MLGGVSSGIYHRDRQVLIEGTNRMFISPIVDRELRIALRKYGAVKSRFRVAAGGAVLVCVFLFFGWLTGTRQWGGTLHKFLFYIGLYLTITPAVRACIGLFCEERRNQTLELLYLANLSSADLFLGKLLGGILIASGNMLALMPFLAVPFLGGGVSLKLFLATFACFPVMLLITVAISLLASVLCRDEGAALVCSVIIAAVLCLALPLPYILATNFSGAPPFSTGWLCLSPAYAPYLITRNFAGGSPQLFWQTAGVTVL
jgi:ABC-type Na+ efflux pump permease subunit